MSDKRAEKGDQLFNVRLPKDVHRKAKEAAWRERTSLNKFIVRQIEAALRENQQSAECA